MNYNYFEAVCSDVREALNDELWSCDRVTGNASGSYDSSPWLAEERLAHNLGAAIDKVLPDFEGDFNAAHGAPGTIKLNTIYSTKNGRYIVILRHPKYGWYGMYASRFSAWLEDFDYLVRECRPYFGSYKSSAVRDCARKVIAGEEARDDV